MKKMIIVAVVSFIGTTAFAQSSTSPMHFGLKAGVNLPKYDYGQEDGENGESGTTTNFHLTGYLDAPLGSMFSIQPGLSLQGKGGEFDTGTIKSEQNTLWLEVPVNLVVKFPMGGTNFFLGAGPYGAFGISGENKVTIGGNTTTSDVEFGDEGGDDLKSTDFGVNFMGGIQMGSGFNIGAGYGLGLSDLRPSGSGGNGQQTNRVLSFSLGFAF